MSDKRPPEMAVDRAGWPVLLARTSLAEDLAVAREKTSPDQQPSSTTPTSLELARRRDAVRDAAREFEDLSDQDVRERLRGLTNRELTSAEIAQFREDARAQALDDLVDALDQNRMGRLRARRRVRVVAPKGYLVKVVRGLSEDELAAVESRLRARGWTESDVHGGLMDKRPDQRGTKVA